MNTECMYTEFKISKGYKVKYTNSGKKIIIKKKNRIISAPNEELKAEQKRILKEELSGIKLHDCAYGFVPVRGIRDNAEQHIGKKSILNIDMKDFFTTITGEQVYDSLIRNNVSKDKAAYISKVCILHGVLPQGAPTSPTLSNIVAKPMDKKLYTMCKKEGMTYTRYADDLTISANCVEDLLKIKPKVFSLINKFGWKVSSSKVNITSNNNPKRRQEVTGITVNVLPNVSRKNVRNFESMIHHIECDISNGIINNLSELNDNYKSIESLIGYSNFMQEINPNLSKYMDRVKKIRKKLVNNT